MTSQQTMSLNIQERQRNAIVQMLSLEPSGVGSLSGGFHSDTMSTRYTTAAHEGLGHSYPWKVLVYDRTCQNVLSPLMKVGSLRQHGVTLHLLIDGQRTPVIEAPAVYVVEPTEVNIERIVNDMKVHLYQKYFINFSSSIPRPLLEKFAISTSLAGCSAKVTSVVDRFLQFVSLSPSEFSLDLGDAFKVFHGVQHDDGEIETYITKVLDGLLSVIVTLGAIPIIRCTSTSTSPARLLGQRLNTVLKQMIENKRVASQLLSGSGGAAMERPILILLDREVDLGVMLHHTWSYQALVHDLFGLRLNRVTLPQTEDTNAGPEKPKVFDIDASDAIWTEYGPKIFPEAAVAISDAFQDYSNRKAQLDAQGPTRGEVGAGVQSTLDTLNVVPEMIVQKKSIDMHTNIAHAIVAQITSRGLDKLYELEDAFETASVAHSLAQLEKILDVNEKGLPADKERAAVCLYLARRGQMTPQHLKRLKEKMQLSGASTSAVEFVQRLESFKTMQGATAAASAVTPSPNVQTTPASVATNWGANFLDRSKGLLEGVRSLLPLKKTLPIAAITSDLMQNRSGSVVHQEFEYYDPKIAVQLGIEDNAVPRVKAPFRQGVVFVLGGGSYTESHALKEVGHKTQKQIVYGSTDFTSPEQFLRDLNELGACA